MKTAQVLALAALLGSIPFSSWLCSERSRRLTGARVGVWVLEAVTGFIPVHLARNTFEAGYLVVALAGAIAVISRSFSYWRMFRPSGVSMATAVGAVLGVNYAAGVCAFVVWLVCWAGTGNHKGKDEY